MARDDTLACAKWNRSPHLYLTVGRLYSCWDRGCFVLTARCGCPWMSLRRVVGARGWSGSMVCGTCMMPGVLLHVTRQCMRGVCINDRFAVGLRDCMMGGASVMRGTVMIG
jgi:hypothetical protein